MHRFTSIVVCLLLKWNSVFVYTSMYVHLLLLAQLGSFRYYAEVFVMDGCRIFVYIWVFFSLGIFVVCQTSEASIHASAHL